MKNMIILFIVALLCFNCIEYNRNEKTEYKNNNKPNIDFLQPWEFCYKTESELEEHFQGLVTYDVDTLIVQYIAEYNKGEADICYYDSDMAFRTEYSNFLDWIIAFGKKYNIKIIVGLASDAYWWKYFIHHFSNNTMNLFYQEDVKVLREVMEKYEVEGVYYSNEMFTNPFGYEIVWSKYLNKTISNIESYDVTLPLYISPFDPSYLPQLKLGRIKMWERFFKNTNFRTMDVFLLQDGYGSLSKDPNKMQMDRIYKRDKMIRDACLTYSKANFGLNIELFASSGYANRERVLRQLQNANKLGNVIACFTISHYCIENERGEFFSD